MIPKKWEDQTAAAISYLRSRPSLVGVRIGRTKNADARQVVLDTEPQQFETPISRRVAILIESWVLRESGAADVGASFDLMSTVLYELQLAPDLLQSVVRFDAPIGPRVVKDASKTEYHEGTITWVVSR